MAGVQKGKSDQEKNIFLQKYKPGYSFRAKAHKWPDLFWLLTESVLGTWHFCTIAYANQKEEQTTTTKGETKSNYHLLFIKAEQMTHATAFAVKTGIRPY